jgi:amino-acid N-acetyltransferase
MRSDVKPMIEQARRADLPGALALLRAADLPTDGVEQCVETMLVARDNGVVVGTAALEMYAAHALLRSVAVDVALRGHGLGAALVERAIEMARRRGVVTVYLLTETAPAFFARLGFDPVPRSEVAESVRRSVEFTLLCSETAYAMRRTLVAGR